MTDYEIMQPNKDLIEIDNNEKLIKEFIKDMILMPSVTAHKWSEITNQTPNLKIGYPGQHLASLITGMKGNATGARGNDIIDGSEVKSCSKIDQSDKCLECKSNVLRSLNKCPKCGSSNIKRNNDSKWLIPVRSEDELNLLINETPRFIFIVTDYPNFINNNYNDIRIRAFEIWVKSSRCEKFITMMKSYYENIYLKHIQKNPNKTPAPKNLFPDNYPFYMCNPIKTFECIIKNALSESEINIVKYIQPDKNRSTLESEKMPIELLTTNEYNILKSHIPNIDNISTLDEKERIFLQLRDTDKQIKIIGNKKHKI